ncbi:MAG: hypothetical protein JST48_10340 [Bacteroidetes bacterium]|nr:hypothetical protein [Bacteroidota bacterium]
MRKSIIIRIAQVLVVLAILWMIFALKVAWSGNEELAMDALVQHELFLKEHDKVKKLQSKLDSCNLVLATLKK